MNRRWQRGFTLLEVVLAVALLAAMTVALLPILLDATQAAAPRATYVDPTALREFADRLLKDAEQVAALRASGATRVTWLALAGAREVLVQRLPGSDQNRPHDWWTFTSGEVRVLRYLRRGDLEAPVVSGAGTPR